MLANEKWLSLSFASVLHESLLIPTLMYGSEIMVWKKPLSLRIRAVHMNDFKAMIRVRRSHRIRELFDVHKWVQWDGMAT